MSLQDGIQLVLHYPDAVGRSGTCRGFVGLPSTSSHYLFVEPTGPFAQQTAFELGEAIAQEILNLGPGVNEVKVPCNGHWYGGCHALDELDCKKCFIPVLDARNPNTFNMPNWVSLSEVNVIPIVPQAVLQKLVPTSLQTLNQVPVTAGYKSTISSIFRAAGLLTEKPKLFISYVRSDSIALAEQLFDALIRKGFEVFLDRFSVEAGANFQRRLNEELNRMGTILLIESANLHKSQWVQHEVDFALAHRLGIVALKLPKGRATAGVTNADRIRVDAKSLTPKGKLKKSVIDDVLHEIAKAQSLAESIRINYLTGTLSDSLAAAGFTFQSFGEDQVIVATSNRAKEFAMRVSCLPPELADFQILDRYSLHGTSSARDCLVVAPTVHMDWRRKAPIKWVGDRVGISINDESEIANLPWRLS